MQFSQKTLIYGLLVSLDMVRPSPWFYDHLGKLAYNLHLCKAKVNQS